MNKEKLKGGCFSNTHPNTPPYTHPYTPPYTTPPGDNFHQDSGMQFIEWMAYRFFLGGGGGGMLGWVLGGVSHKHPPIQNTYQ